MRGSRTHGGFSLLEVLVATALLAVIFTYVSGAFIQGGMLLSKSPRLTQAALLLRGVVLDVEESYRRDGFPENDVTNRRCELPSDADEDFECQYDLEKLDVEPGDLAEISQGLMEQLKGSVGEGGNILQSFAAFQFLFSGLPIAIGGGCIATPDEFLRMCFGDKVQALQTIARNMDNMVGGIPLFITKAAELTRKLRVRMTHKAMGEEPILTIETFIISLPEETDVQSQEGALTPEGGGP